MEQQQPIYLNARQVAQMLGIQTQTLANWRSQHRKLSYSKIGRIVRYSLEDVTRFAESRKIEVMDR